MPQTQALDASILYSLETPNGAVGNNIKYTGEVCEFGRENEAKISYKMEIMSLTKVEYYGEGEGKQKWLLIYL